MVQRAHQMGLKRTSWWGNDSPLNRGLCLLIDPSTDTWGPPPQIQTGSPVGQGHLRMQATDWNCGCCSLNRLIEILENAFITANHSLSPRSYSGDSSSKIDLPVRCNITGSKHGFKTLLRLGYDAWNMLSWVSTLLCWFGSLPEQCLIAVK